MRWLVVVLLCSGVAAPQQQKAQHTFPTKDQIDLLLTQSDRAFDTYEQVVNEETRLGGDLAKSAPKDREVLTSARDLIPRLKKSPDSFNGPVGLILLGNLDDASRNMAVCMGQAGMQVGFHAMDGKVSEGHTYLHLAQTCLDASMLLYTVSETAFNMYSEFLLAQNEMTQNAMATLEQCVNSMKENQKHKQ